MKPSHVPVMVEEVLEYLAVRPNGVYVDATVGLGGHTEAIVKASAPTGRVIGLDRDREALQSAQERLRGYRERVVLVSANFADVAAALHRQGENGVDGIFADLGMSSWQIDSAERGFSFQRNGPLDMRMDRTQTTTAAILVNTATEQELAIWFHRYGEERFAKRIARAIAARRAERPFTETLDFAATVRAAIPAKYRRGKIDAATRVFQALRVVVNGELLHLERFLGSAPTLLQPEGRLVVLSYHSLEDRLVKHRFRELAATPAFQLVTKKPMTPTTTEIRKNPRARSAKLRAIQRSLVAGR